MFFPYEFLSPMIMVLLSLTSVASSAAYYSLIDPLDINVMQLAPGFFLEVIGLALLLVAFLISMIMIFSKKPDKDMIREESASDNTGKNTFNIILSSLAIIASVGIIIGIALPYYKWVYRTVAGDNRNPSILLPERQYFDGLDMTYQAYADLTGIFYLIIMLFIIVASVLLLLQSLNVIKSKSSKKPLFFLIAMAFLVPIYAPYFGAGLMWHPPFMEILRMISLMFYSAKSDGLQYADLLIDQKRVLTFGCYYLYISIFIMLLVLVLMLSSVSFKKLLKHKSTT